MWFVDQLRIGVRDGMCSLRGACPVVVFDELPGHTPNVCGVEEDEMVERILTQRAMKSLDMRILAGAEKSNDFRLGGVFADYAGQFVIGIAVRCPVFTQISVSWSTCGSCLLIGGFLIQVPAG